MSLAKIPEVYVVSDSLGETAESVAKATISQFDEDIDIIRVPFIRHAEQIQKSSTKQHHTMLSYVIHSSAVSCAKHLKKLPTLKASATSTSWDR